MSAPITQRLEQRFRKRYDTQIQIDWEGFRAYLLNKYRRRTWALELFRTAKRRQGLINNLSMLDSIGKSNSTKAKVLQSLIALSKYQGFYEEFKGKMKAHGIKWHKPSSLMSFLRILNNNNEDIMHACIASTSAFHKKRPSKPLFRKK